MHVYNERLRQCLSHCRASQLFTEDEISCCIFLVILLITNVLLTVNKCLSPVFNLLSDLSRYVSPSNILLDTLERVLLKSEAGPKIR